MDAGVIATIAKLYATPFFGALVTVAGPLTITDVPVCNNRNTLGIWHNTHHAKYAMVSLLPIHFQIPKIQADTRTALLVTLINNLSRIQLNFPKLTAHGVSHSGQLRDVKTYLGGYIQ